MAWTTYAERTRLHALTARSIESLSALQDELREVKRRGYAFEDQEEEVGVCSIGAGVRNDENRLVAGFRFSRRRIGCAGVGPNASRKLPTRFLWP